MASDVGSAAGIGLLGKLPAHGDFVRRGGPSKVVARLERWLERELGGAVAAGVGLKEAVDGLGGWCFAWTCPTMGHVIMAVVASEDKVGRRFPLLGWIAPPNGNDPSGTGGVEAWCTAAADALSTARDEAMDADAALAALTTIDAPTIDDLPQGGWWRADAGGPAAAALQLPAGETFLGLLERRHV